jgi:hypothetical protein
MTPRMWTANWPTCWRHWKREPCAGNRDRTPRPAFLCVRARAAQSCSVSHDPPFRRLTGLKASALLRLGIAAEPEATLPQVPGYELLESLGRGGMGDVFRAKQGSLGRMVALKLLRPDLVATGWLPERFEQEARTMAALQHPNVVTVHDCVRIEDGRVAIVMEFIGGGSLREKLHAAPGGLPLPQALKWAREIADGLRAAHGAGVVHRDVKPDNVLIDEAGTARVSDFGLAFSGGEAQTRYTRTGAAAGTPGYMPPEIWQGESADVRSDVFSFGAMLYEMLTGRLPQGSFPPPRALRPDIAPVLNDTIVAALRPDPADRPPDMSAMLAALSAKSGRFSRRAVIASASAGAAAGLAAGAFHWWKNRGAEVSGAGERWTRIPWPDPPAATIIKGGWSLDGDVLRSDDRICILAIPGIQPKPCRLRLRFRRLAGELSIGIFFRAAGGVAVCTLDGRGRHLGGVQMVDRLTLDESGGFTLKLENGREYEWIVEINSERVRMWVDGLLRDERAISGKQLAVPATWDWLPDARPAAIHIGSWESPTEFLSLEWHPTE